MVMRLGRSLHCKVSSSIGSCWPLANASTKTPENQAPDVAEMFRAMGYYTILHHPTPTWNWFMTAGEPMFKWSPLNCWHVWWSQQPPASEATWRIEAPNGGKIEVAIFRHPMSTLSANRTSRLSNRGLETSPSPSGPCSCGSVDRYSTRFSKRNENNHCWALPRQRFQLGEWWPNMSKPRS
jgi:hypothetical protein